MFKAIGGGLFLVVAGCGFAEAATCPSFTYTLTNNTTADANQVMSNFNTLLNCANNSLAPLASPNFTGNVGIGGTGPNNKLTVNSNASYSTEYSYSIAAANATIPVDALYLGYDATIDAGVIASSHEGLAWKNTIINPVAGNVGIGTTTPSYTLDVLGGARIVSSPTSGLIGWDNSGHTLFALTRQTNDLSVQSFASIGLAPGVITGVGSTAYAMYIQTGGKVGIGTTSPAVALAVVGDVRTGTSGTNGCVQNFAGTALTGTCSSDGRLKTVLGNVSGVLDGLANLDLVHFKWNDIAATTYHDSKAVVNTGFIAQSVEKPFPELVSTDEHGYKQVNYTNLQLYGLEAIKELKAINDNQAKEIASLQSQIGELRKEVAFIQHSGRLSSERQRSASIRSQPANCTKAATCSASAQHS